MMVVSYISYTDVLRIRTFGSILGFPSQTAVNWSPMLGTKRTLMFLIGVWILCVSAAIDLWRSVLTVLPLLTTVMYAVRVWLI